MSRAVDIIKFISLFLLKIRIPYCIISTKGGAIMIRIRELRNARGWGQKDLAAKLQISYQAIGNYETGRREPDIKTIFAMCDLFGVTADYLLGRSDMPKPLITEAEWRTLDAYRRASLRDRQIIDQILAEYAAAAQEKGHAG